MLHLQLAVNSTMAYAVTDYAKLAAIKPGTGSHQ